MGTAGKGEFLPAACRPLAAVGMVVGMRERVGSLVYLPALDGKGVHPGIVVGGDKWGGLVLVCGANKRILAPWAVLVPVWARLWEGGRPRVTPRPDMN